MIINLQAFQGFQVLESSYWNALKFIIMKKSETEDNCLSDLYSMSVDCNSALVNSCRQYRHNINAMF
jgi:hypothetical protein